ncbi:MAG: DUF2284 domain-containing protein [Eubacteriales bacterium]|nr:DUF2284 domain-containing protein [Eubacteriales bacterium]
MNRELLESKLSELPLYIYDFIDPNELEFSERIRLICQHECPKYGTTWACPPGVGTVAECQARCAGYQNCLLISSIAEVADIADIDGTLATRPAHEALTEQVAAILREQGEKPYILSTQACSICDRCAILDGQPCRFPEKMHPCVESHGINVVPILEKLGLDFQFGANVVTWISLLLF